MALYAQTINSKLTQAFGAKHSGEDYVSANGTNIVSPVTGTVFRVGTGSKDGATNIGYDYGKWIVLRDAAGCYHLFAHLNSNTVLGVGAAVTAGVTVFAKSGQTGAVTGPHIHWSVYGTLWNRATLTAPRAYIEKRIAENRVGPNQRQVLATVPVKRRAQPSTTAAISGDPIAASAVVTLNGWISGEMVTGNAIWFRHPTGDFSWSGGFTDTGTHDLTNLNIQTRTVSDKAANRRAQPTTTSPAISPAIAAKTEVEVKGFATGQAVTGNAIWFKAADGNWSWSGGFTSQSTTGLTDLTSEVVVPEPIKITTFGIDVSSAQKGIDFVAAKADGVQFVIVKLGGHNTANRYVTPDYAVQVDAARKAGLKVGHYYVTGQGDAIEEAEYFVRNLHNFDLLSDVLVLDNELFDTNGGTVNVNTEFWPDTKVAAFFERVKTRTGIPATRLWHYSGAAAFKSATWPLTEAMGVKVWWAAYGNNPTDRHPQEMPILGGAVSDWWVHQFSSKQTVAGWSGNVDGNWSREIIDVLFATGAITTPVPEKPDNSESIAILEAVVAANEAIAKSVAESTAKLKTVIENLDDDNY